MKKILILILVVFVFTKGSAQLTLIDTAQYLKDSIVPKTNYYVGKKLGLFLNDIKVKVKSYIGPNIARLSDTVILKEITLDFNTIGVICFRNSQRLRTPHIHVKFSQPIKIPKRYFEIGGLLAGDWDAKQAAYLGKYIISSLEVRGL